MSTNPTQGPQNWQQPQQQQPYPTPGQPSAPYPPQQPPQPPKKKHTGCKVAGATLGAFALILIVIAVAIPGDGSGPTAAPASAAPAEVERGEKPDKQQDESPEEPGPAQMGDKVQAGAFAFVVSGIECGIERVGDEFLGEEAQGQYCVVDLSITNNGNEAVTFFEGDNTLVDGKGREYATSEDSIYLQNGDWLLTDINPGNTAEGQLLFDVPDEVQPTKIVLAGSGLFDNPVEVALS